MTLEQLIFYDDDDEGDSYECDVYLLYDFLLYTRNFILIKYFPKMQKNHLFFFLFFHHSISLDQNETKVF